MRIDLYTAEIIDKGKLSIMGRARGGDWLEDELAAAKDAGVNTIVSCLTDSEVRELDLEDEARLCESIGIQFVHWPIPDRGVPVAGGLTEPTQGAGHRVGFWEPHRHSLSNGARPLVAGRREPTLPGGRTPAQAFAELRAVRGQDLPDTEEQRRWVERVLRWG